MKTERFAAATLAEAESKAKVWLASQVEVRIVETQATKTRVGLTPAPTTDRWWTVSVRYETPRADDRP